MAVAVNQGFGLPPFFFLNRGLKRTTREAKPGGGRRDMPIQMPGPPWAGTKEQGNTMFQSRAPGGGGVHSPTKMAFFFEQKTWPIAYIQQEVPGGAS
jgi:hypothetical protein